MLWTQKAGSIHTLHNFRRHYAPFTKKINVVASIFESKASSTWKLCLSSPRPGPSSWLHRKPATHRIPHPPLTSHVSFCVRKGGWNTVSQSSVYALRTVPLLSLHFITVYTERNVSRQNLFWKPSQMGEICLKNLALSRKLEEEDIQPQA